MNPVKAKNFTGGGTASRAPRKSGVELLKIIGILLICCSHCVQSLEDFTDFQIPTTDIQLLIMRFLRFNGNLGNMIFVICSSYFLIDSKRVKKNKAINLALDSQLISIGIFAAYLIIGAVFSIETDHTVGQVLNALFPDIFATVWFVPTYIIFYLVHPYFNRIISSVSQREHFAFCLFVLVFYGGCGLINCRPAYSNFLGFVLIYFIVAYFKLYCNAWTTSKKKNILSFTAFFTLFVITVICKNFLAMKIDYFKDYPNINELTSIILFPMMLSLFFVFLNIDFTNRFVNYLSSLSLFVYCIHENILVREMVRPKFYEIVIAKFGNDKLLLYAGVLWVIVVIAAFVSAALYKAVFHRFTAKISVVIEAKVKYIVDHLFEKSGGKVSE